MSKKTTDEVLESNEADEIHDWLETATVTELRRYLRKVVRGSSMGQHARDALDIRLAINNQKIANCILVLTIIAVICGIIQAFGVFWIVCQAR